MAQKRLDVNKVQLQQKTSTLASLNCLQKILLYPTISTRSGFTSPVIWEKPPRKLLATTNLAEIAGITKML